MGGFLPRAWVDVFWRQPHLLLLLWRWLQWELGRIFVEEPSRAIMLEQMVINALMFVGLHEESLVEELQTVFRSHTTAFV